MEGNRGRFREHRRASAHRGGRCPRTLGDWWGCSSRGDDWRRVVDVGVQRRGHHSVRARGATACVLSSGGRPRGAVRNDGDGGLDAAAAMGADLTDTKVEDGGDILAGQILGMMRETDIPNGLSGVGYSMDDLDALTDRSYAQKRLIDNGPMPISRDELKDLFRNSMTLW